MEKIIGNVSIDNSNIRELEDNNFLDSFFQICREGNLFEKWWKIGRIIDHLYYLSHFIPCPLHRAAELHALARF